MNLTIKNKLFLIVGLVLFGYLALFIQNTTNQNALSHLVGINNDLKSIETYMLQLRRSEKDFLLRKDVKYQATFEQTEWVHICSLLDNAGGYCPEQLVIKINALYLAVFPTDKIDKLINETGITYLNPLLLKKVGFIYLRYK
ncbi:MAG: hypothetical protein HRT51_01760 [Colwellia sp.]|nr:hypothetical protein [Colwellia sp.]